MRWLICIIPLFLLLACDNPLGPGPLSGTYEGKNGGVFIPGNHIIIYNVETWDITINFSPTGVLNWSAKFQNNSDTKAWALNMAIAIFPDDSRTHGTELAAFSNRNFDLMSFEQESVGHSDPTSLNPPPAEFYWTLSWGER
jgi:hypothetical protein